MPLFLVAFAVNSFSFVRTTYLPTYLWRMSLAQSFPIKRGMFRAEKNHLLFGLQQCDQIGQFLALWATFQSRWQKLFCPNCPHFFDNFWIGVKIFYFSSEIIFGSAFKDIWWHFTGHAGALQSNRILSRTVIIIIIVAFD